MSNRSTKFVSAIFASVLAGTSFAAVAENGAQENNAKENSTKESGAKTANNCLSGPKGTPPAGGHWYYRTDHATKRNCWYIGEAKNKAARTATKDSSVTPETSDPASAGDAVSPQQSLNVRKSIADARAELTAPQARVEDLSEPRTTGAVPVASIANGQRAVAPEAATPSSAVVSRWPDSSGVSPSSAPRLAAVEPQATPQAAAPPAAAPQPQPAVTPVALAAADTSLERRSASIQMLLLVMAGALALAGVTASLVFRFGRAQAIPLDAHSNRRAIWDSIPNERALPPMFPDDDTPIWRSKAARTIPPDPRAPDDPERRVTEMLTRLARSAQT